MTMLALLGPTGRGKTVAAAWLLADLGGFYTTGEELRRAMRSYNPRDAELLLQLYRARSLIVDDLGTEQDLESARTALFEVVNRRMGLPRAYTVLTSNLSREAFAERYGERTLRRLEHQGLVVEVEGEDLRRPAV
jgi:DNA replication protein DnaC